VDDLLSLIDTNEVVVTSVAVVATMVAVVGSLAVLRIAGRRSPLISALARTLHRPTQLLAAAIALRSTLPPSFDGVWREPTQRLLGIIIVLAIAWQVTRLLHTFEDAALGRFRTDVNDNLAARRVHTQVRAVRRVSVAVVNVLAFGAALLTFPELRAAGASILASAGLIGVIAALAAQSTLGNVIAGLQLAFGGAVRLDDVVVVDGEWGRVEEITLGYVVVRIWDERRLVLPASYLTSTPFENWTKSSSAILGTVEIDVDWSTNVDDVREALNELVSTNSLWDGRVCQVQVTNAVGGTIRIRALVSAADSPAAWDLRCQVREGLVRHIQHHQPQARPKIRAHLEAAQTLAVPASRRSGSPE
jgi:small-conductance mechanosensitive channel